MRKQKYTLKIIKKNVFIIRLRNSLHIIHFAKKIPEELSSGILILSKLYNFELIEF
jgi:hypothetical protein